MDIFAAAGKEVEKGGVGRWGRQEGAEEDLRISEFIAWRKEDWQNLGSGGEGTALPLKVRQKNVGQGYKGTIEGKSPSGCFLCGFLKVRLAAGNEEGGSCGWSLGESGAGWRQMGIRLPVGEATVRRAREEEERG